MADESAASTQPGRPLAAATSASVKPSKARLRFGPEVVSSQGFYRAFGIQVVTLDGSAPARPIAAVTIFNVPSLVTSFGFPLQLPG